MPIPKGTRDFLPKECRRRSFLFRTLENVFQQFAFEKIETPSFENNSTLFGKYGEEGDTLIFRVLNSGDFLKKAEEKDLKKENFEKMRNIITEKSLRYDLTVPFSRYVVDNFNDLTFPFRRYQIQPVWRADKPQKGRYREFTQCDADIIGTYSLLADAELLHLANQGFSLLGLKNVTLYLNNRKIINALTEILGLKEQFSLFTVIIDKLDKIGIEKVIEQIRSLGCSEKEITHIRSFLSIDGNNNEIIEKLASIVGNNSEGKQGISELQEVLGTLQDMGENNKNIVIQPSLARGLNYYTGSIFEAKHSSFSFSILGGGRYDNLTQQFSKSVLPGVGISFGADRIYDVMEAEGVFKNFEKDDSPSVLIVNFDNITSKRDSLKILQFIRKQGIAAEFFYDSKPLKKQFQYANKKNISHVLIIGEQELKNNTVTIKNMKNGEQKEVTMDENTITSFFFSS